MSTNMLVPTVLAQGVLPNKAGGLTVHSSIAAASAMFKLMNKFKVCASYEDMEQGNFAHLYLRIQYEHSADQLKEQVRLDIKKISNKSAE
jgi:hypothetical protein